MGRGSEVVYDNLGGSNQKRLGIPDLDHEYCEATTQKYRTHILAIILVLVNCGKCLLFKFFHK